MQSRWMAMDAGQRGAGSAPDGLGVPADAIAREGGEGVEDGDEVVEGLRVQAAAVRGPQGALKPVRVNLHDPHPEVELVRHRQPLVVRAQLRRHALQRHRAVREELARWFDPCGWF